MDNNMKKLKISSDEKNETSEEVIQKTDINPKKLKRRMTINYAMIQSLGNKNLNDKENDYEIKTEADENYNIQKDNK
ncbi:Hypothetical protein SRAE_X000236000 [Strongyloides ratti]|uniref:Uncharacterized protein n=1 Tax=Strongyloides ratti TaxID=34506 RepID=A0A090KT03_STRRB|nr:Hypothetical protein SRAE_X000236000 [Strongyloides ratti]CEF60625.1 Hypothetical protein SRAE_X000236000 [Strongyloides ratti]